MSLTRRVFLKGGAKLGKLKRKHNKRTVKLKQLEKIAKKASIDNEFVFLNGPCYELDNLEVDAVIELR